MQRLLVIIFLIYSGSLLSCEPFLNSQVVKNTYAKYFKLYRHSVGWFIDIFDRENAVQARYSININKNCDGVKSLTPGKRVGISSSTYLPYLESIDVLKYVTHVAGKKYLHGHLDLKKRTVELGENLNIENILKANMSALFGYSLNNSSKDLFSQLSKLNYPIVTIHEFLEASALARLEWLKVFGIIFGEYDKALSVFSKIENRYKKEINIKFKKKVLIAQEYEGSWYVPGNNSFLYQMLNSLGCTVLLSEDKKERTKVNREEIIKALDKSTVWFPQSNVTSRKRLLKYLGVEQSGYEKLKIFNISKKIDKNGSNDFWQSGVFRPDLVVKDLKIILSGGATGLEALRWYEEL